MADTAIVGENVEKCGQRVTQRQGPREDPQQIAGLFALRSRSDLGHDKQVQQARNDERGDAVDESSHPSLSLCRMPSGSRSLRPKTG